MIQPPPITQRKVSDIVKDINCIVDIIGLEKFMHYEQELLPDKEGLYHIKDWYEALITYCNYKINENCKNYLNSLKL